MGANHSKEKINEDLKIVGRKESENEIKNEEPKLEIKYSLNTTNNFILQSKSTDPKNDYNILQYLKKGVYSDITLVENKITNLRCIMKTINKVKTFSKTEDELIKNESKILSLLDHPNIINIYAFYSNENSLSYITEFCQEGDLYERLLNKGEYDEKAVAYIMHQIFSAINYCHKNNVINRDLSIENILISEIKEGLPTVKIGYFGTSTLADKNLIQKKNNKYYTDKSDIWLCGVIMYFLLTTRPPFIGGNEEERKKNILYENFDVDSKPFDKISLECKKLLRNLLKSNPVHRPSAEEVLKDIWFEKNNSKKLFYNITRESTLEKLITNIKNYKNTSIFQKYTISYLIHNFPQLNDVKNSAKLFYMIDTDGDGKITKEELFKGLNNIVNNKIPEKEFDILFKHIDLNNNGFIDYEEFIAASVNKNIFMRNNILLFAFKFFDKDDSGEITFDEIETMFKEAVNDGKTDVHQALKKIIQEIDLNIDGKISFEEFSIFVKQLIK